MQLSARQPRAFIVPRIIYCYRDYVTTISPTVVIASCRQYSPVTLGHLTSVTVRKWLPAGDHVH